MSLGCQVLVDGGCWVVGGAGGEHLGLGLK